MIFGEVEGREVVPVILNLRAFGHGETNAAEDAQHLLAHQAQRVAGAQGVGHGRQGVVEIGVGGGVIGGGFGSRLGLVETGLGLLFQGVKLLAYCALIFGGHGLELVEQIGQATLAAEVGNAKSIAVRGVAKVGGCNFGRQRGNGVLHLHHIRQSYGKARAAPNVSSSLSVSPPKPLYPLL